MNRDVIDRILHVVLKTRHVKPLENQNRFSRYLNTLFPNSYKWDGGKLLPTLNKKKANIQAAALLLTAFFTCFNALLKDNNIQEQTARILIIFMLLCVAHEINFHEETATKFRSFVNGGMKVKQETIEKIHTDDGQSKSNPNTRTELKAICSGLVCLSANSVPIIVSVASLILPDSPFNTLEIVYPYVSNFNLHSNTLTFILSNMVRIICSSVTLALWTLTVAPM
ncbi:unnamed protein product [Orchesella dallaii]|uniref:Uncharacterized protein n=1 Tax=Orchesella dallaii TaxID=48710 RepID=A0ABP1PK02_9HEXA